MELELCRICDIYGETRQVYLGRSQGFQRKVLSLELFLRKKWFSNSTPQLRAWRSLVALLAKAEHCAASNFEGALWER
eukprot:9172411-Pyramimonas_sp.AAC.1